MSFFQAIIMGIIQGLTEFIPVSSSGHLVLFQYFFGMGESENIVFELFLHLGTLFAVLIYFRKTLWELFKSLFCWGNTVNREQHRKNRTLVYYLIISTLATAIIYILVGDYFKAAFAMPILVAFFLLITGGIVFLSDYFVDQGIPASNVGFFRAVIIGIGQGIAILPGVSRSGTTIAYSLATGMKRKDAAQYSFLLSIPAILAGNLSEYKALTELDSTMLQNYLVGFVSSFIIGYLVIAFLIRLIENSRLKYFWNILLDCRFALYYPSGIRYIMEAPIFALDFAAANVNLGSSYLLVGTDSYLVDKVIETIKKKLKKKENIDTFIIYGDDVKSSELADILDTYTIFSSAKLVILKNAEQLNKYELKTLSSYFSSPSEIQSLAIATEKIDLHNESWKQIKAHSTIINCESPRYGGAIRSWLDKSLKDMNKTMTIKAIEEFINRIELDYYYAANELNKLDLLTTGRNRITEEDVMKSLGTTRTGTLIDFYRALGKKQEKQAIEALEKMLNANWEFLQIFFQFTKFYNNIWHILLLKKAHISDNEIVSKHLSDIYPNQRKEFLELSRSYNLASLEKIFTILLETDQQFKLSVADSQILLITCLIRVMEA